MSISSILALAAGLDPDQDFVQRILDRGEVTLADIGVVTPYKGQVRVMRKLLHTKGGLDVPEGQQPSTLEIASVDNFQGREKEVIIFSAVRCNKIGSVGFLKDWRRLNVMITRARRALVVIGNAVTLCKDEHWLKWLECTEKQGGAKKGTVKKALEDGETYEHSLPCPLTSDDGEWPPPRRSSRSFVMGGMGGEGVLTNSNLAYVGRPDLCTNAPAHFLFDFFCFSSEDVQRVSPCPCA